MILTNEQLQKRLGDFPASSQVVFSTLNVKQLEEDIRAEAYIARISYDEQYNRVVMSDLSFAGDDIEEEE